MSKRNSVPPGADGNGVEDREETKRRNDAADERSTVSRRSFIKSTGLASVAVSAGVLLGDEVAKPSGRAQGEGKWLGPGPVDVTLKINGKERRLNIEPRVTLLDAMRNHLDLTGAKKVCDRATCGACTVIIDGKAHYSCTTLAIDAQGHDILTIEGIAPEDKLHPMSQAYVDHDASQCGFCTPGFVMASKAYIDHEPNPTYEGLQKALGGNLCRCGTYMGIREAVLQAAKNGGRA